MISDLTKRKALKSSVSGGLKNQHLYSGLCMHDCSVPIEEVYDSCWESVVCQKSHGKHKKLHQLWQTETARFPQVENGNLSLHIRTSFVYLFSCDCVGGNIAAMSPEHS